ncbi:MAG: T9SS type A sorting domain-containing protein [Fibromonadales bacterium]|nr:T9SS type A sorting domain-containing protein [Fibromonadales bacterium]
MISGKISVSGSNEAYGSISLYSGGLLGYAAASSGLITIIGSHSSGDVSVTNTGTDAYSGGLVGIVTNTIRIEGSHSIGNVSSVASSSATSYSGGLVGGVDNSATIVDSYSSGDVVSSGYSGGLAGWINNSATVVNSYSSGNVAGTSNSGGLIGTANGTTIINTSYTSGNILGSTAGGLVGSVSIKITINDSYVSGNVSTSGSGNAGGLIGNASANSSTTISNSYVSGNISASYFGGIFGYLRRGTSADMTSVYYKAEGASSAVGRDSSLAGTLGYLGVSSVRNPDLKKQETFIDWDFSEIWGIDATKNSSYPYLRVFYEEGAGSSSSSSSTTPSSSSDGDTTPSSSSFGGGGTIYTCQLATGCIQASIADCLLISGSIVAVCQESSSSSSEGTNARHLPGEIASSNQATQIHNGINLQTTSNAVVEIYDLNGNLISKQNFGSGIYNVSLGHLPKGLYIAKAKFGSEKHILRIPVR